MWRVFISLYLFKFLKVIVYFTSWTLYKPCRIPAQPTITKNDVTVIIPTVGDLDDEFVECISSILATCPVQIILVTIDSKIAHARDVCNTIDPKKIIVLSAGARGHKRVQIMHGVQRVQTKITVLADDHVFWPQTFLQSALAPFEEGGVGIVGTVKRVRRIKGQFGFSNFINYIACLYLERHNFECTASSNIDGCVFVISGRTVLLRTTVIKDPDFAQEYLNEYWLWGLVGPLHSDDDNFITRWMVNKGWKTIFHNDPGALMETSLGTYGGWKKFRGQLDRWARTSWRSNSTTLFVDRTVWKTQLWSAYAVHFSAFVNLAFFYDGALFCTLYHAEIPGWVPSVLGNKVSLFVLLGASLFLSKLIKSLPYLCRNPRDIVYLPFGIMFGYWHSWVKLWALLTCWDISWGTRPGVDGPMPPTNIFQLPYRTSMPGKILSLARVAVIALLKGSFITQLVDFFWKERLNDFDNWCQIKNEKQREERRTR
jgi:cellulose synthase/poly-beta-1,6-N-acetylglucosamine synthase-like glycosyltransferase